MTSFLQFLLFTVIQNDHYSLFIYRIWNYKLQGQCTQWGWQQIWNTFLMAVCNIFTTAFFIWTVLFFSPHYSTILCHLILIGTILCHLIRCNPYKNILNTLVDSLHNATFILCIIWYLSHNSLTNLGTLQLTTFFLNNSMLHSVIITTSFPSHNNLLSQQSSASLSHCSHSDTLHLTTFFHNNPVLQWVIDHIQVFST